MPTGRRTPHRATLLALSIAAAVAGCGGDDAPATATAPGAKMTEAQMADEVAAVINACSYDGAPVSVRSTSLGSRPPGDCVQMVDRIMQFTGLPQNFVVAQAAVPNAAAAILLDDQRVPRRVIAFNPDFITAVGRATGSADWGPMSIMAHEIGHHLSGHTITQGRSQPPIELEADKFSGFVLYKMGAPLADATRAIETIGGEGSATHPPRAARVAAIREGWMQACVQQGDGCEAAAAATTRPPVTAPATAVPAAQAGQRDRLPQVRPDALPAKTGRFVVDATGLLEPGERTRLERSLFEHAQATGVEIVLLVVDDLQGLDGDDFAWAMLRQLRIGKLDVGNGAVLVVAPKLGKAGVAMGPGIALEMEGFDPRGQLERWARDAWPVCVKQNGCGNWTTNLSMTPDRVRRQTEALEWSIRYANLADFITASKAYAETRKAGAAAYDPKLDPSHDRLVRFEGEVVTLDTPVGIPVIKPEVLANAAIVKQGRRALHVRSADGPPAIVYLDPRTVPVMPSGLPEAGARYTFVGRAQAFSPIDGQAQHFWLLSWDRLD